MKGIQLTLTALLALSPAAAFASSLCPGLTGASSAYYSTDTTASGNCNVIITVTAGGVLNIPGTPANANPYDGNDDNYIGVINNSGKTLSSITLTGSSFAGGLFAFDGDGIDAYGITGNTIDTTQYGSGAYGGSDAYYTNIDPSQDMGTINFIGGIAAGSTGYFSLEGPPQTIIVPMTTPEPSSLVLLSTGLLGVAAGVRRRLRLS